MSNVDRPTGQQYRHVYLDSAAPAQDSPEFRQRIFQFLSSDDGLGYGRINELLHREFGIATHKPNAAFLEMPIAKLLSVVTAAAHKFVNLAACDFRMREFRLRQRERFLAFVARALVEENLAYELDEHGGVHPRIDSEFQRNRQSVIASLTSARYVNVAASVQSSFDRLAPSGTDTKAAVRDIFDAGESLFKLLARSNASLTEQSVDTILRPVVSRAYADKHSSAQQASGRLCSSFGKWADACHPYRHGQAADHVLAPPMDLTVVLLSQCAGFIRWLVDVDSAWGKKHEGVR